MKDGYVDIFPRLPTDLLKAFLDRIESLHPADVGEILRKIIQVIYDLRCLMPGEDSIKAKEEVSKLLLEALDDITKKKEATN